ncbi:hypothetical protein K466DRAFT_668505 [Polyporus arcularius HHB13444]|uniref:Uncharacterized protein n=1 Tax=Polyporus arcularius HHB13444 TaxID=1314778 RepID=A0A5C3NL21_9APHY|nr:hypothetical protein K466DRAFT_668505 [Polyporus arcularius HHB13444]
MQKRACLLSVAAVQTRAKRRPQRSLVSRVHARPRPLDLQCAPCSRTRTKVADSPALAGRPLVRSCPCSAAVVRPASTGAVCVHRRGLGRARETRESARELG